MRPRRVPPVRRTFLPLLLLAAACGHLAPAHESTPAEDRRPKVLMVFLDGFLPDAIARTDTPNLDRLLAHAAWSLRARAESTTISGSGWSTFLTGVHWDKHGVPDNAFEHPRYDRYRHVGALLREARPEARWASCQSWKPIEEGLVRPARPDFHFYVDYDAYQGDHFAPDSVDARVAAAAEGILQEEDPDLAVVMFGEMDSVAHSEDNAHYDAGDPLYQRILHRTDSLIGRLLDAIAARPTRSGEDWLVIVSADHAGSKGLGHGRNIPEHRQIPLIVSGDAAVPGEIWPPPAAVDVVATALHHLGVTPPPEWVLDGQPLGFAATAPPVARLGRNLLFDGDAEWERGHDGYQGFPDASVPGWEDPSWLTVIRYGAPGGFPGPGDTLPDEPGRNFFAGGQAGHDTWMEQVVDLAPLAEDIAAGVEFELSAWLGGYAGQADRAELRAEFRDAEGQPLRTAAVGPVTAADRKGRTGFRLRRTSGRVPPAARSVAVRLTCIQVEGANDGYADNLSLVLRRAPGERGAWWDEARFGIFIHWGLYAIPGGIWKGEPVGGTGEWIMRNAHVPPAEYEPLREQWNPVRFDARAWARLFREAGAGYVVITTKHHDGFCLYDAPGTDWDVMSTPWKRDVMAELAPAVRAEGMRIGWYHSILDWHHPDYLPRRPWDPRPADTADFGRYRAFLKQQVRHLLTAYGPIGVMWFDGEWEDTWTHAMGLDLYDFVRSLQPDILVNNRVDKGRRGMAGLTREGGYAGDFGTPEQEVPATGLPGTRWESCMTMNDTWGWKSRDHNWKSADQLIRILCDTASKGGNFLLNVGPTAAGEIPPESVERLRAIGRWLARNGAAIRGTQAGPFRRLPWGRATRQGDRLYLLVFDWPTDGRLPVPGLRTPVRRAWLLADPDGGGLEVQEGADGPVLAVPATAPDAPVAVVILDLDGPPEVVPVLPRPDADGRLRLAAADAGIHGQRARYEPAPEHRNIGYWTDPRDTVSWAFRLPRGGAWRVWAEVAAVPASAGGRFRVRVGDRELPGTVPDTGSWTRFTAVELGVLELAAGRHELFVEPLELAGPALMNLRSVVLERLQ